MQCSPNISEPQISQSSPEGSGVSGACICFVCSSLISLSIRACCARNISGFRRSVDRFSSLTELEELGDTGGAQGLERAVGENFLNLKERGRERLCENPQGREALLQLGDLDGKLLCAGLEPGEALLQLGGTPGEVVDLPGEVLAKGGAGATEPEISAERADRTNKGERGADEHQDHEDIAHSEATVPRGSGTLQTIDRW